MFSIKTTNKTKQKKIEGRTSFFNLFINTTILGVLGLLRKKGDLPVQYRGRYFVFALGEV